MITAAHREPGYYRVRWNGRPWVVARYDVSASGVGYWSLPPGDVDVPSADFPHEIDDSPVPQLHQSVSGAMMVSVRKLAPSELPYSRPHQATFDKLVSGRVPHENDFYGLKLLDKPGTVFVDIGGNIGNSALSVHFVCPDWRVVSIEPNPSLRPYLESAGALIKSEGGKFEYHCIGFADRAGELPFFIPEIDDWMVIGESSILLDHFDDQVVSRRLSSYSSHGRWSLIETSVQVVRFDDWVSDKPHITSSESVFVKIDVEGAECLVMSGMTEFIRAKRPSFMIENSDNNEIPRHLSDYGYVAYDYIESANEFVPDRKRGGLNKFYFPN